jgi:hypothetical protein
MRRDLESRLPAVETKQAGSTAGEVWIEMGNGMLGGPRGETITPEAFRSVSAHLPFVLVLPDNGRDAKIP